MKLEQICWVRSQVSETDTVVAYAAAELADYVRRLCDADWVVHPQMQWKQASAAIWLGVADQIPGSPLTTAMWDDGYAIWAADGNLYIVGRNARSVLFGVYAFLEMQGVRYVFPRTDGEVIPHRAEIAAPDKLIVENAHYRHRGVCIEGATSLEHALGMVDWCAKKRMNTIFLQFVSSRYFYNNWYERKYNPRFASQPLSDADALLLDDQVITAMKKRGLIFHRVGHGWTGATVELPRSGWVEAGEEVKPQYVRWLAEVGGERRLFHDIPINTELCYSHQPAFGAFIETIVHYCEQHPELDVVHVWLSDATNNKCECAECRKLSISDWYARVINTLSRILHERVPKMRFVFLCYIELLWAPEQVKMDESYGNAILMFAPIARCYGHVLHDPTCDDGQPWPRPPINQFAASRYNDFYIKRLADWRKVFQGDSFDFDYHLMWAIWFQLTDTRLAWLFHQDLQQLKGLGLDGIVSCQSFRVFYPSGLAMAALAESLWNPTIPFERVRQDYLEAAYGEYAAFADGYLRAVEMFVDTGDAHWRTPPFSTANQARLAEVSVFLERSLAELSIRQQVANDGARRRALALLAHHARLLQFIVHAYQAHLDGKAAEAGQALDQAVAFLQETEPQHSHDIDAMLAIRISIGTHRAQVTA